MDKNKWAGDAEEAASPGWSPTDSWGGRWLFVRHRKVGRTLPYRIGISRRVRRLAPVSRSIYRLHRVAQRTCVNWVTLEPNGALVPRWQPVQWGLTEAAADALRKRTDPSWSSSILQPQTQSLTSSSVPSFLKAAAQALNNMELFLKHSVTMPTKTTSPFAEFAPVDINMTDNMIYSDWCYSSTTTGFFFLFLFKRHLQRHTKTRTANDCYRCDFEWL